MTDIPASAAGELGFLACMRALGSFKATRLSGIPTDRELARVVGVSATTIGTWLCGDRFPQQIDLVLKAVRLIRAEVDRRRLDHELQAISVPLDDQSWRELYLAEAQRLAGRVAESAQRAQGRIALAGSQLMYVPHQTEMFVGRVSELAQLDDAFTGQARAVVQAVHGLGGVGKSALAARWVMTRSADHDLVWWIMADSRASLEAGLAGLAVALRADLAELPLEALAEQAVQ